MGRANASMKLRENDAKTTDMKTVRVTPELVQSWIDASPEFQRGFKRNAKWVRVVQVILENNGRIPGVITLALDPATGKCPIIDGQYRSRAFLETKLPHGIADVRFLINYSEADQSKEFYDLQNPIAPMTVDDRLRALHVTSEYLQKLRKECPFLTYAKSSGSNPISMSVFLRAWITSSSDSPSKVTAESTEKLVLRAENLQDLPASVAFARAAFSVWGRSLDTRRLWGATNLTLTAWCFRRLVLIGVSPSKKVKPITISDFSGFLAAISAHAKYDRDLIGRCNLEHDRGPMMDRLRRIYKAYWKAQGKTDPIYFPEVPWTKSGNAPQGY